MENASKALIMAAGVFMAITLLAIGVSLFVKYRNIAQTYDEVMTLQDAAKINKEFEKYVGRTDITIQEIVSAAQTANSVNEKYNKQIWVQLGAGTNFNGKTQKEYIEEIKKKLDKKYEVTNDLSYNDDGLVTMIVFTEKP